MDDLVLDTLRRCCPAAQLDLFLFTETVLEQYNIESHELPMQQLTMQLDSKPLSSVADSFYSIYDETVDDACEEIGFVFNENATLRDKVVVLESFQSIFNYENLLLIKNTIDNSDSHEEAIGELMVLTSDMQAERFLTIIQELSPDVIPGIIENLKLEEVEDDVVLEDNALNAVILSKVQRYYAFNSLARDFLLATVPVGFKMDTYFTVVESNLQSLSNEGIVDNLVLGALMASDAYASPIMAVKNAISRLDMEGRQGTNMSIAAVDTLVRFEKFLSIAGD